MTSEIDRKAMRLEPTSKTASEKISSKELLTDEQLDEVSGGDRKPQTTPENAADPKAVNRIHQRRLELIDNPELAQ